MRNILLPGVLLREWLLLEAYLHIRELSKLQEQQLCPLSLSISLKPRVCEV